MVFIEETDTNENESSQEIEVISNLPESKQDDNSSPKVKNRIFFLNSEYFSLFITLIVVLIALLFFSFSFFFNETETKLKLENPSEPSEYALKIDLNKADSLKFELLPGIGPRIAQRIIEYRVRNDGFKSVDELENVKGISLRMVNTIRPFVYVEQNRK